MYIKSIKQLKIKDLKDKRVLVRCDFDVPLEHKNTKIPACAGRRKHKNTIKVGDDTRLRAILPTVECLVKKKSKVILMGHLGRPGGRFEKDLSLALVVQELENLLNQKSEIRNQKLKVEFINDCIGPKVEKRVGEMGDGEVLMLENLRFYMGERKNDDKFAKELSKLADIYVNESIAVSHRKHASFDAIRDYLPGFAGLHLEKEVVVLYGVKRPSRPLVFVIGGAKVATKLPVIDNFLFRADYVLTGGVVANNFLKAAGFEIGKSRFDKKYVKEARRVLEKGERGLLGKNFQFPISNFQKNFKSQIPNLDFDSLILKDIEQFKKRVVLPVDLRVETRNKKLETRELNEVDEGDLIFDIGPRTVKLYERIIRGARTVVWNGPMGWFEDERFAEGTENIAKAVIDSRAKAIIGGGESVDAVKDLLGVKIDELPKRVFVSMAGGAMLELLAGEKLPGLKGLVRF